MQHHQPSMIDFLDDLVSGGNEHVFDEVVDIDVILARQLQEEEETMERERRRRELADFELARKMSQQIEEHADADREFALRLANELHHQSASHAAQSKDADADFAFALSLQDSSEGRPPNIDDRAFALALFEQEKEEMEQRRQRELKEQQDRNDAEYARRLMQEEERAEREEQERIERQRREQERIRQESLQVNLTRSEEGLLAGNSDAATFMRGCNLAPLRNFVKSRPGCKVRAVRNEGLIAQFVALRDDYVRLGCGDVSIAFHGTKVRHLPSIEEKGLLVPGGENAAVRHEHDSGWWGRGIYTSRDPQYAMGYAEAGKLIVVAVLLGRSFEITQRRDGGECEVGYHSHIAENGQEWVLFESAQVLPLFVIDTTPQAVNPPKKKHWKKQNGIY